ncbi:HDOD domain-containing protein [Stutzerimonas stutzeri]|uniref:HDOD domain-containing protein n=1 Tax=Stutzerimonas stutzeri TaxID=316 RepID=UPI002659A2C2|nr:HDOD domain-containing protein [Stutzerimonas stutzeri]MCF6780465.1 response regulator [Stutzerimonas stutzeri]MCF6804598.1 response regulator [Stutzerimonas stutzeri]
MPIPVSASFVLIAFSDSWRADQLGQLVASLRPRLRILKVHDGYAALAACKRELPRLLIVDGELDGLDGRAVLRELRRRAPRQQLACILISERMDRASVRAAIPLGLAAYLGKPCDLEGLSRRLDRLLPPSVGRATQAPTDTLAAFLERMRQSNPGAPLLESVQVAVGDSLSAAERNLNVLEARFSRDPQITARLISVANSAGQAGNCQTLAQALQRLGVRLSLDLVLEMAVQGSAQLADPDLARQAAHVSEQAQRAAKLAGWLARRLKLDASLCYTAGLLHSLGELAVLRSLQNWLDSGGELGVEELPTLLRTHAAGFGSSLRIQWRLPLGLRQAIAGYYGLGAEVFTREALVLNLTGLLLALPADASAQSLAAERSARLLRVDPQLLIGAPRD